MRDFLFSSEWGTPSKTDDVQDEESPAAIRERAIDAEDRRQPRHRAQHRDGLLQADAARPAEMAVAGRSDGDGA